LEGEEGFKDSDEEVRATVGEVCKNFFSILGVVTHKAAEEEGCVTCEDQLLCLLVTKQFFIFLVLLLLPVFNDDNFSGVVFLPPSLPPSLPRGMHLLRQLPGKRPDTHQQILHQKPQHRHPSLPPSLLLLLLLCLRPKHPHHPLSLPPSLLPSPLQIPPYPQQGQLFPALPTSLYAVRQCI